MCKLTNAEEKYRKNSCEKIQKEKKNMNLDDFLDFFDFSYEIIDWDNLSKYDEKAYKEENILFFEEWQEKKTPCFHLVDNQGANLGNIESCLYETTAEGFSNMVERMTIYINDYVFDPLEETLDENNIEVSSGADLCELKELLEKNNIAYSSDIVNCIINPNLLYVDERSFTNV